MISPFTNMPFVARCEKCSLKFEREQAREAERKRKADERRRLENIEQYLERAGVPKRHLSSSLENFKGKIQPECPAFVHGPPGSGKTHLAVGYLRERLLVNEYGGRFVRAVDLFKLLRESFEDGSRTSERKILTTYGRETPFLVLDDLGSEKVSEYVEQSLYDLIDTRYNDALPTLITSNLSPTQLAEHYRDHGERLVSRIAGMGIICQLKGKDRRMGGK